jgi:hypothetical protein
VSNVGVATAGGVAGSASSTGAVAGRGGLDVLATPVRAETASSMQSDFGVSGNNLFLVGHGQVVSSGGTASAIDVYSHMSNDTILASSSRDYEISSGAQMQFRIAAGR